MTIHIMLDLETWGTAPGSDIRSIGACVFDPVNNRLGDWSSEEALAAANDTFYVACDNPLIPLDAPPEYNRTKRLYPLTRDPRTVQWWSEQTDEARAAFADPCDLMRAGTDRYEAFKAGWDHGGGSQARNVVEGWEIYLQNNS